MSEMNIPLFSRIKSQILLSVLASFILIASVLAITLYSVASRLIINTTTDNALNIAESLAGAIDVDALDTIRTIEDEDTEAYREIRETLFAAREMTGCKFIYTMRQDENGAFVYVVDGSEEELISHVGDEEELLVGFEDALNGTPYKGEEIEDQGEWGVLASAYYPLANSSGEVVAILGVDYDASDVAAGLRRFTIIAICISLAGVVVCAIVGAVLAGRISRPIVQTTDFAATLAAGNLDAPITVTTKNEAGKLAHILDQDVRQAFRDIREAQAVAAKQADYQQQQVQKVLENLQRLANGELLCDMRVSPADADTREICAIYQEIETNLDSAVCSIKSYVDELTFVLGRMADGDFTENIQETYLGDFASLKHSINRIVVNINQALASVVDSAAQVASGTQQVSDGSQSIAHGTSEQSSAIEQLKATIVEIAEQTRQTAEDAGEASTLTESMKTEASTGNDKMRELQGAMSQINDSSQNIGKVIKVIEDIAFQTNILALNAAVEAARAGSHGQGFAVVAEEVRNLAQRSANAANDTTAMIEDSMKKAEAGTKIADETAYALSGIVANMGQAGQLIGGIAAASASQAAAITQINQNIDQISQVMHMNSAATEETAATSEQLLSQTEMLKAMIAHFKLRQSLQISDR